MTEAQTGPGRNQAYTNTNDFKDRQVVMWVSQAGRQLQVLVFAPPQEAGTVGRQETSMYV